MIKKMKLNNSGILLVEAVISIGIIGILMISLISMMQLLNNNSASVSVSMSKNEIINKIRLNSVNLLSIENSAKLTLAYGTQGLTPDVGTPNNNTNYSALADCIPTLATGGACNKALMQTPKGFPFYLTNGVSTDKNLIIAGEDVYYTLNGQRCDQAKAISSGQCPIAALIWAEPYCSSLLSNCNKAISLTIRYKVFLRGDYQGTAVMAPIEGEVYLPLSKGIQISRVLTQVDNPISINNSGVYSVQKFYGLPDQNNAPSGLRFEAILGNPTGLTSMRLQYRYRAGSMVSEYLDDKIPAELNTSTWSDVQDPMSPGTPWTVQLIGAKANQIINFGTQSSATSGNNINKDFKIGASVLDAPDLQAKFRWGITAKGELIPPTFKSGFYQFRILSTDVNGNNIESMNYVTVRIVSRPQFLIPPSQPSLTQIRNCISEQKKISYFLGIADDEKLGEQKITLNGVNLAFTSVTGTSGLVELPFELSQKIAGSSQSFSYNYTAENHFTGKSINSQIVPISSGSFSVNLSEKPVLFQALISNPSKIRIATTGTITANFEAGSCCQLQPSVSWTYPAVPEVSQALLSGPGTSAPSCDLDTTNNKMSCTTNVVAKGMVESPSATSSPDIAVKLTFSQGSNACTGGSPVTEFSNNAYVPVVKIPGIQFYLTESIWLTLPSNPIQSLKEAIPKVYVRADFQPDEDVIVGIYKSSDNTEVCKITFEAGVDTKPIDKSCSIPSSYSGDLTLKRISSNVMIDSDVPNPSFRAKLISGKLNHRTCQPKLTNIADFADYTVASDQPMLNSPWGFTMDNSGNVIQDPKNDTGLWTAGRVKKMKCYDTWSGNVSGNTFDYSSDIISIPNLGTYDVNVQDIYRLYRYNMELKIPWYPIYHNTLGSSSATTSKSRFQTYIFPNNPNLDFDPKNAPYVFLVYYNGTPASAVWQFVNPSGASGTTPPKSWTDYTPQLCNGSSALSQFKVLGIKAVGHSTAETVMKAVNNIYSGVSSGFYSYHFMCEFGEWNPSSKSFTSWVD